MALARARLPLWIRHWWWAPDHCGRRFHALHITHDNTVACTGTSHRQHLDRIEYANGFRLQGKNHG